MTSNMTKLSTKEQNRLTIEIIRQMLTLATAGFGLVAALAWNSLIQALVENYIKKWLPDFGEIATLFIYAVIVTILAVFVTYQLSKILRRFEAKDEKK